MQSNVDPKNLLGAMHFQATGELMRLMDGFYSNLEDGLFELAYASEDGVMQRSTVDLMRELRFRREHLLKTFGKRLQNAASHWYAEDDSDMYLEERTRSDLIASRCSSHFAGLLQAISERITNGCRIEMDRSGVPLGPEQVSYHFVMTCRSLELSNEAIGMVQDLFHRFVLDRLGGIYGEINRQLREAGFLSNAEIQEADQVSTA